MSAGAATPATSLPAFVRRASTELRVNGLGRVMAVVSSTASSTGGMADGGGDIGAIVVGIRIVCCYCICWRTKRSGCFRARARVTSK